MVFEIKIADSTGRPILKDAFYMESITTMLDFSWGVLRPSSESTEENAFELFISSEMDCHIFYRFDSLGAVMQFKNALYGHLIELNETPSRNMENANELTHLNEPYKTT
ncbi:hypothetical protein [Flagellimonas sp.]|jgi:hypothetical protein|uniref:hypothetical protein n=1 Tax=Flagellimonas sp. TaxID=2058762 RepID=UPI003BAD2022